MRSASTQGPKGRPLLGLIGVPHQQPGPAALGFRRQLGGQAALADAGFPEDGHHATGPLPDRVQGRVEPRLLTSAPDQGPLEREQVGRWGSLPRGRGRVGGERRRGARPHATEDVLVEELGLHVGLDPQLPLERRHAHLVLAERGAPAAQVGVQPHERPVDGFLERIEREETQGRVHRGVQRPRRALVGGEAGQRLDGSLTQPLPLGSEPLLEGRRLDHEARQKVAAVETRGPLEPLRRPLVDGRLETPGVDLHQRRVEGHPIPVETDGADLRQRPAEVEEHLA